MPTRDASLPSNSKRRTQQQRSAETKRRLLEATIDLLIERGYARLTTDDIAKRAGVSNGGRVHHFRTKEELVVAANKELYANAVSLGTARSKSARDSAHPIKDCFDDLLSLYFGRWFLGSLDATVAARTDKRLAKKLHPIIVAYHADIRRAWTRAFAEAGFTAREADDTYEVVLHTVRGMALSSVRQARPAVNAALVRRVAAMLETRQTLGPALNKQSARSVS
jgi:AcrR family transcriptional regulator